MLRRLRRVPLPLGLLLIVATIQAVTWIVLLPPFQGPDEDSHFAYAQKIFETRSIPWHPGAVSQFQQPSDELVAALRAGGMGPLQANVGARPLWTRADERAWNAAARGAHRSNGGLSTAFRNPPVYYLYELVPYGVGSGGTVWDRSLLMRLSNLPLFLIALVFMWLLAGEVFGRGSPLQFLSTAAGAFVPQLLNEVATINPDLALVAIWSVALYLMALIVRRGLRRNWLIWLAVLNVVGGFTQPRSLPLLIPSALAVLLALARERGWSRVTPLRAGLATVVLFGLVTLVWSTVGKGSSREFLSYLWQFYLPKLGFMNTTIGPPTYDVHTGLVDRIFGTLAQLEVGLPPTLDDVVWWTVRLGVVALVVALLVKRDAVRANAALAVVLATAFWTLLLGVHLIAYRSMLTNPGDPIITGRYLLPVIGLFGIAVAVVAAALPRVVRGAYGGLVIAAGVTLQLISLGLLLERFYA